MVTTFQLPRATKSETAKRNNHQMTTSVHCKRQELKMSQTGKLIAGAVLFLCVVIGGGLAYYASNRMISNTPDAGASNVGAAPVEEAKQKF
jgi:hypothetical protein